MTLHSHTTRWKLSYSVNLMEFTYYKQIYNQFHYRLMKHNTSSRNSYQRVFKNMNVKYIKNTSLHHAWGIKGAIYVMQGYMKACAQLCFYIYGSTLFMQPTYIFHRFFKQCHLSLWEMEDMTVGSMKSPGGFDTMGWILNIKIPQHSILLATKEN